MGIHQQLSHESQIHQVVRPWYFGDNPFDVILFLSLLTHTHDQNQSSIVLAETF